MRIDAAIKSNPNYSRKRFGIQMVEFYFLRDFSKPRDFHPLIYVVAHQMLLFALFFQLKRCSGGGAADDFWGGETIRERSYIETIMCIFGVIVTSLPFRRQSGASFKNIFSGGAGELGFVCFLWIFCEGFTQISYAHFHRN